MARVNEAAIMDEVATGLLATGDWRKPTYEHGLMKLKTVRRGDEFRIDLTPTKAMIYAVEFGVAEHRWTHLNADDILEGVAAILADFREKRPLD